MMRAICTPIGLAVLATGFPAMAQEPEAEPKEAAQPRVEVVARDDAGKATRVSVDGREYALCSDTVQDSCISPCSAGFDWGKVELDHWPGQTATSLKEQDSQEEAGSKDAHETVILDEGPEPEAIS